MAWGLLAIGAAFAIGTPMLIAVGMYLPFDTSSAIFVGGLLKLISDRFTAPGDMARVEGKGTLIASGLVSGEAIMGIVLAVMFLAGVPSLGAVPSFESLGGWLSLGGFAAMAYVLVVIPLRKRTS